MDRLASDRPDGFGGRKPPAGSHPLDSLVPFRTALTRWFAEQGRDYPWRRTRDPYRILVSEVMLQQTRIETVLKRRFYESWLERFPGMEALAAAGEDELLKAWEGLGYYRRARNLQAAARAILDRHGGLFPRKPEELRALPGVGAYTAGAVLAFAYDEPAAMVDGNVARVLARLFDFREPVDEPSAKRQFEDWSLRLVDPRNARAFQGALMELGQTLCARRNPGCLRCPVAPFCQTRAPEQLPVKRRKVSIERVEEWVVWAREGNRVYLEREAGARRKGLWRLPRAERGPGEELLRLRYAITRYQVTMHVLRAGPSDLSKFAGDGGAWFDEEALAGAALASPDRRAVERLLLRGREPGFWDAQP